MRYTAIILGIFGLFCSCKTLTPHNHFLNQIDGNGDRITVLAYRIFIDGKIKNAEYSYKQNTVRVHGDTALGSLQYGDINFLFFSSKKKYQADGMAPPEIENRVYLKFGNSYIILRISPKLLGKNIYIDSLPLISSRLIIDSLDSMNKISLSKRFRKLKKNQISRNLIADEKQLEFRRFFALDTLNKKDPIEELFKKDFFEVKFENIKK